MEISRGANKFSYNKKELTGSVNSDSSLDTPLDISQ